MRPHAAVRAIVIISFLAWVLLGIVPLFEGSKHVRRPDAADSPQQEATTGGGHTAPAISDAQAIETLRRHGYFDIGDVRQLPNGDWTANASRSANGRRLSLRITGNGDIVEE
jgi:hypothetical protein